MQDDRRSQDNGKLEVEPPLKSGNVGFFNEQFQLGVIVRK